MLRVSKYFAKSLKVACPGGAIGSVAVRAAWLRESGFEAQAGQIIVKGVASMRQNEAIASSCFRRRQIFAHLFHDKANVNFN